MTNGDLQLLVKAQKAEYSRCLHPSMDCEEPPIRAHSIQNSRILDLVQTEGHVIMPRYRIEKGKLKAEFKKVGRNDASTFTGLCSKHDAELFKAIDNERLNTDNCEHRRQLAYRAIMREFHTELENAERANALHCEICKAEGKDPHTTETAAIHLWAYWIKKSQKVYAYRRRHFDAPRENGSQPNLRHLIITIDNQAPVLACSALFSTGFTKDGAIVGPTLNVAPLNERQSVALLSGPGEQWAEIKRTLSKVFDADEKTLKHELAKLIIGHIENFTLSPAHYEKWSDDRKARVLREFEKSLAGPVELEDHPELNIFL
jgi:hypothetical protein